MDFKDIGGFSYNGSGISVKLTPEQEERLKNFRWIKAPEMWDTGFISPNQINDYYCKKCNEQYTVSPKPLVSVAVIGERELLTSVGYKCTTCENFVYHGNLESPKGIPEEFIAYDETGEYRKPTQDSINSLLDRIKKQANDGQGQSIKQPSYRNELKIAKRWAEKIGYDLQPEVEALTDMFKKGYVARLERELPEIIKDIKEKAHGFNSSGSEEFGCSHYEGTGLSEPMEQLFQTIDLTKPQNPEINADIFRILELYCGMVSSEKEKLVKEKKDLEARLAQEEESLAEARRRQSEFTAKVGLTNEQVDKARETPLSTWPLEPSI